MEPYTFQQAFPFVPLEVLCKFHLLKDLRRRLRASPLASGERPASPAPGDAAAERPDSTVQK
jgi:hypothetical protein